MIDPRWEQIEKALNELIGALNPDLHIFLEVERRGEAALQALRELRREASNQDTSPASERWTQEELDALKAQAKDRSERFGWSASNQESKP